MINAARGIILLWCCLHPLMAVAQPVTHSPSGVRAHGITPGILSPGPLNAITDVAGVRVGHVTFIKGSDVRTGVTAILPHGGNLYQDKVPAGIHVGNGYGKLMGITQVHELGEIESPIILTNTLNVAEGAIGAIEWTLEQPGNERVGSVNAIVGETNDGGLNNIRKRSIKPSHVRRAIETAAVGPVAQGNVGAGTGTTAFGWKGGIGTSSRLLPAPLGGYTVGVLIQSNFGGVLRVDGFPAGQALDQYFLRNVLTREGRAQKADGSIMIVVATNAPLSDRNLERLARRAMAGVARTGASLTNGSGDYVIAFSTHENVRRTAEKRAKSSPLEDLPNAHFSPLSQAVIEATEEAILNSLFMAKTMDGYNTFTDKRNRIEALPVDQLIKLMQP